MSRHFYTLVSALILTVGVHAQTPSNTDPALASPKSQDGLKRREPQPGDATYQVPVGTHVLLNMINSVSTKTAQIGDRLYLETAFPILAENRILIPQGSWVAGTITEVRRPGRVKGRGELQVRFDSLTLPNGVTRNFRADLGNLDGRGEETLDREKSKVKGDGNKKGDAETVAGTTITGAGLGTAIGAATGGLGRGAGIGAAAGAAAGLIGVLASRGPDAMLTKGTTVEMVLDRPLSYGPTDLDLSSAPPRAVLSEGTGPQAKPSGGFGSHLPL